MVIVWGPNWLIRAAGWYCGLTPREPCILDFMSVIRSGMISSRNGSLGLIEIADDSS